MKTQLSDMEIQGESVPFSFKMKTGGQELRPAPLVYVNDLKTMLFHLLDEKHRLNSLHMYTYMCNYTTHINRLGQLTWHDGLIPSSEIWVKLGGDKGGTSFKTSLQTVKCR